MKALIFLDEKIDTKLGPKGNQTGSQGKGILYVRNPSTNTTLWSVKLDATHGDTVSGIKNEEIPHIQQGQEYMQTYEINLSSKLVLTERIDTFYTDDATENLDTNRDTLIKGQAQKILFEFTLENNYEFPLTNIILTKDFDESFVELDTMGSPTGTVDKSETSMKWTIDKIDAGSTMKLLIVTVMNPKTSGKIETGKINVSATGSGLFSDLKPAIDSECDNVDLSVDVNETETPGIWTVSTEFINSSEFAAKLETVHVSTTDSSVLDEKVDMIYDPSPNQASWSKIENLNSADYPTITKKFKYQVDHEIKSSVFINIDKETDQLDVVEILAEKIFEPSEVNTYTRTPLEYNIKISNVGTATIGVLELEEVIPPYFLIHGIETFGGGENTTEASIVSQEGFDDKTEGNLPSNLSDKRKMMVKVKTTEFVPGSTFTAKFDCTAEKPKPNLDYQARSIIKAFAQHPTHPYEIQSKTEEMIPELKVKFAKRSFKSLTNYKGISDNEYEITIQVTNNGEVPLENIYVKHQITGGEYKNHQPVTVTVKEEGGELEYFIKSIQVGGSIDLISMVETKGPIRQTQPSIRIAD